MNIAMNEDFRIAYKYSDEVIANIKIPRDGLVDVNEVLNYIRSLYFPELVVYSRSFAGIGSPAGPCDTCGAMARLSFNGGDYNAAIVLNSDLDPSFQRFALIQQIGHLLTLPPDVELDPDSYVVSTRISYDLSDISQEDMERDRYLLREQVSNVFALRVLMPVDQFFRKIRELNSVESIARFYGVPVEAVISRMMIGA